MNKLIAGALLAAFAAPAAAEDSRTTPAVEAGTSKAAATAAPVARENAAPVVAPKVKAKAKAGRKQVTRAQAAQARAMLDAEINRQGEQVVQYEAARQAEFRAEQMRQQSLHSQQLDAIRRLTPPSTTVVRARPDGTYDTRTYYVYPNNNPAGIPFQP